LEKRKQNVPAEFGEEGRAVPQRIFRYFKLMYIYDSKKVKQSRYMPGVTQRVPGS